MTTVGSFGILKTSFSQPFSQDFSPKPLKFVHKIIAFQTLHMIAFKPIKFEKILWKMNSAVDRPQSGKGNIG